MCPPHCLCESADGSERADCASRRVRGSGAAGTDGRRGCKRPRPVHGRAGRAARRCGLRGGGRGRPGLPAGRGRSPRLRSALRGRHLRPRTGRLAPAGSSRPRGRRRPTRSGHPGDGGGQGAHARRARRGGDPGPRLRRRRPGLGRRRRCAGQLRRRTRLAPHRQGGPGRLRRQGRLARARPGRGRGRAGRHHRAAVLEELLPLEAELAVMVARRPSATRWPGRGRDRATGRRVPGGPRAGAGCPPQCWRRRRCWAVGWPTSPARSG